MAPELGSGRDGQVGRRGLAEVEGECVVWMGREDVGVGIA